MKGLRNFIDKIKPNFEKGGKFEKLHSTFDAFETFLFVPNHVTRSGSHIRDSIDLKRVMIVVVVALMPALLFGMYNTGLQHFRAIGAGDVPFWTCFWFGLLKVLPIIIVSYVVGLGIEFISAQIRHHEVNEGFLVSGMLIPLVMPVDVPLWMVAVATAFAVIIGKEVFGGYGSYPFNPAAVGYAVAAVSWPEQVFRYPQPYTSIPLWDASMVPVSSTIEDTLRSGGMLNIRALVLSLGEYAAPMGTGAALVILACGLFLWTQKDAHMSASVSFLLTCALIAFLFPRQAGLADSAVLANVLPRLRCVRDELLTGAILFSAVFLLNEPYTCVHHRMGRILYGVLVGAITMGFRYYGVYETGVCFALLTVNSISGWMDRTESRLYQLMHRPAAGKEGAE